MKKSNIITILLFVFFLASIALGYFFPGPTFSEMEKRYLADMPKWNWPRCSWIIGSRPFREVTLLFFYGKQYNIPPPDCKPKMKVKK